MRIKRIQCLERLNEEKYEDEVHEREGIPLSQKNHQIVEGKLLQTDKKYAQLKLKQKEKIAEWIFQETRNYYQKHYVFPDDRHICDVIDKVYAKIESAEIWIPYDEVFKHYKKKRADIHKRVKKSLQQAESQRTEKVCFMNMCMILDENGNVLALDKVNDSYTGTTFPGGHVEDGEIFQSSVIREVFEETGLEIKNPLLFGVYHWSKGGIHNVLFLYKATEFSGDMKSSEEGNVYWIPLKEFEQKELATGMEYVLEILTSDQHKECYMKLEAGGYVGTLY